MRRSTVQSLSPQLIFPKSANKIGWKIDRLWWNTTINTLGEVVLYLTSDLDNLA